METELLEAMSGLVESARLVVMGTDVGRSITDRVHIENLRRALARLDGQAPPEGTS